MMDATETGEAASVAMGDGGIAQGRLIIVGDVHGCLHELRQLMGRIEPAVEDRRIFIGDKFFLNDPESRVLKHATVLDTGWVFGGQLSALDITEL
jgi:hypothetical protein